MLKLLNKPSPFYRTSSGFTLIEVMASITIFTLVLMSATEIYSLGQRWYQEASTQNELWQNARVVLDRTTREIRQAAALVTTIPTTPADPLLPPPSTLEFQDGHDITVTRYIRYSLEGNSIYRRTVVYYFPADPATPVYWNSRDSLNNLPQERIEGEAQLVGEYFTSLNFWGADNVITISVELEKKNQAIEAMTAVYGRNL